VPRITGRRIARAGFSKTMPGMVSEGIYVVILTCVEVAKVVVMCSENDRASGTSKHS